MPNLDLSPPTSPSPGRRSSWWGCPAASAPRLRAEALDGDDDYLLIDCPPSLGLLTVNAVVAAHSLLVPIQCEYYALEGLGLITHTLELLRRELNPTCRRGHRAHPVRPPARPGHQVVEEVRRRFPDEP